MTEARLAVDIGGTFTDVVLERDGAHHGVKVLTTPGNPADGFMSGIRQVMAETGAKADQVSLIIHGTTLATNALIERNGAKTALIVTEGHRDSLEMAYENRFDQYDINAERRPPLAPRELRLPVTERVDFLGEVLTPLDDDSVEALVPALRDADVQSVAIGLLHSYANPSHEQRVAEILRARLPDLWITPSSEVCPEIREYERQSTACANAYVQPLMARYLEDVQARLAESGFACPCLMMTSGGNLVTIPTAQQFPVRLVESGPAGGAILAAHIARSLNEPRVLSFDMGGTTAKICLIDDGEPMLSRSFEVDRAHRFMKGSGMPVKIPVVEMVEIGAGGGSITGVDALNRIQVGPHSAGAEPGPACYGQGGVRPTVTDANLAMGRIDAEGFAGGTMTLDAEAARAALLANVGKPMDMDAVAAAEGVIEIVDENMASATRVHAVERGTEVAGRAMIAFGGAAPLHAARLAEKLGIDRVIVPANAGVGSAVGMLLAPIAYEVVRSRYMRLSDFDAGVVNELFSDMRGEAVAVVRMGAAEAELREARFAYARYVGQGHEIKVALPEWEFAPGADESIRAAFERDYERQYGRTVPGLDIEVLTWSATVSASLPDISEKIAETTNTVASADGARNIRFPGVGGAISAALYQRPALGPGCRLEGPAAIGE
ncbi:MAG: hydantoinase/oxoprolinase family protein, partial [Alphaproteobacteria bacterium]|nr:hydantoinase/oxoprolinase family protein [Alphaproteobacteria bacterium]